MSLTGNLEDLPLLDIIQIVSFSKKTGYLTIRTDDGEAAIVFLDGAIIAAFTWDSLPIDPRAQALPPAKRAGLIRNRIEIALEQLSRLRYGQFSFALTDDAPKSVAGKDITPETLEHGINAQEVLLDLARGIDEDRRDSSAVLEASFAQPEEEGATTAEPAAEVAEPERAVLPEPPQAAPVPAPACPPSIPRVGAPPPAPTAPSEPIRTVLLVDDEDDIRKVLLDRFVLAGFDVVDAGDTDAAVKAAHKLGKAGTPFLLVTDLGMPTSGGSSFHGGFEIVKRLWKMNLKPPVLMMTESLSASLKSRARQMGISGFVFKPGLSKLDRQQFEADLKAFAEKLARDVLPRLARAGATATRPAVAAAPAQAAAPPRAPAPPQDAELTRQLAQLQRHLDDLRSSHDAQNISLLVMKVAREFFERGILFLVKNEEARGLGGFGPSPRNEENVNLLVREVVIPLNEPSVVLDVVDSRKPFYGPLPEGKWTSYLLDRIGRFSSSSAALLPLLAHRETIAVLYGDNPETGRELPRLPALELFVTQAGIALENVFLQRKLQAMKKE